MLELRQRGEREFLITVAGRVLMTSAAHRSESALALWLCDGLTARRPTESADAQRGAAERRPEPQRKRSASAKARQLRRQTESADAQRGATERRPEPQRKRSASAKALQLGRARVMIGGLGMGYTLRAALDALPRTAHVRVAELEPAVVAWCRGPLAPLTARAIEDPRVEVVTGDAMDSIRAAASGDLPPFDAIALDLFAGPRGTRGEDDHPIWGTAALALVREALAPEGALGIWCEEPAPGLARRLARVGFRTEERRAGRGGRRHALYRAVRASSSRRGQPNR
jgi:hypothetical protein